MNESCRSRFFFQPKPTKRICLFLHGFTAEPAQFVPMAATFFKAGSNVLVPLLPGQISYPAWVSINRQNMD
jgi:esterase/lipase